MNAARLQEQQRASAVDLFGEELVSEVERRVPDGPRPWDRAPSRNRSGVAGIVSMYLFVIACAALGWTALAILTRGAM